MSLEQTLKALNKAFGEGSVVEIGKEPILAKEMVSTGSIGLDKALSGGLVRGRIIEMYGSESCIFEDSFIPYEIWDKSETKTINRKGGSIKRLYDRFHKNKNMKPKQGVHLQNNDSKFFIKSINDDNVIIRNEVLDVVKTGRRMCFCIKTSDNKFLLATKEHKFLTLNGYKKLEELFIGDYIFTHNNYRQKGRKVYLNRPEVFVKYHPCSSIKYIKCKKTGNKYKYYRVTKAKIEYEAALNGISSKEYINVLNTKSREFIDSMKFIKKGLHIHHIDENFNNNKLSNLMVVNSSEHGKIHIKDRLKNLSFIAMPHKIIEINKVKKLETYDIKCYFPYNNYIANGIVTHNSGKTTIAIHMMAEQQKYGKVVILDSEQSFDLEYAKNLGLDTNNLIFSQPETTENACEIIEALASSGEVSMIVIDSIANLSPRAEVEGDSGQANIGIQARLMAQHLRKISPIANKNKCTILYINQLRSKIGVMFGPTETTTSGNALKYIASVRLDARRIENIKNKDEIIGIKTRVRIAKNKTGPPLKTAEFEILFGKGINKEDEILEDLINKGVVTKSGGWYVHKENKIQGKENMIEYLRTNEIKDGI